MLRNLALRICTSQQMPRIHKQSGFQAESPKVKDLSPGLVAKASLHRRACCAGERQPTGRPGLADRRPGYWLPPGTQVPSLLQSSLSPSKA